MCAIYIKQTTVCTKRSDNVISVRKLKCVRTSSHDMYACMIHDDNYACNYTYYAIERTTEVLNIYTKIYAHPHYGLHMNRGKRNACAMTLL